MTPCLSGFWAHLVPNFWSVVLGMLHEYSSTRNGMVYHHVRRGETNSARHLEKNHTFRSKYSHHAKSLVSLSSDIDPPCDFACAYDKGQVPSVWKTHATSPRDYFSSSVSFPRTWSTTSFMVSPLCLPKPTSSAACLPISCVHNAGHLSKILEKKTCWLLGWNYPK